MGENRVLAVIGMHRSGTSLLTNILDSMGVHVGDEAKIMVDQYNERGYWENLQMITINDAILHYFGSTWSEPWGLTPSNIKRHPTIRALAPHIQDLLARYQDYDMWAFKDPRATLTMPFWDPFLPTVDYFISVRNPLAVAHSLKHRDNLSITEGAMLWYFYTISALYNTEHKHRMLVFYEAHFDSQTRDQQALKIAQFIGDVTNPLQGLSPIDESLKHHDPSLEDLLRHSEVPPMVKTLYQKLVDGDLNVLEFDFPELFAAFDQTVSWTRFILGRARFRRRVELLKSKRLLKRVELI